MCGGECLARLAPSPGWQALSTAADQARGSGAVALGSTVYGTQPALFCVRPAQCGAAELTLTRPWMAPSWQRKGGVGPIPLVCGLRARSLALC